MYSAKATSYNGYEADKVNATTTDIVVELEHGVSQLLVYPNAPCYIKLNDNTDEIFLSENMWMPLSLSVKKFTIRAITGIAEVHWQGWYI